MRTVRPSRALAGVAVGGPLLVLLVVSVLQVAVAGEPDGAESRFRAFALGVTVVATVLGALISALARWVPAAASRALMTLAGGAGAAGATAVLAGTGVLLLLSPLVGMAWARVVAWLHGRQRPNPESVIELVPERDRLWTPPTETVRADPEPRWLTEDDEPAQPQSLRTPSWQVQVLSPRMAMLTVFGAVTFTAIVILSTGVSDTWWLIVAALFGVAFCGLTAAWAWVEVRVDDAGFHVRSRLLRLPLLSVAPHEILGVASAEVDPMDYGGWGLRWNARHTAFIVKGGPGVVLYRSSGRRLAIETPHGSDCADQGALAVRATVTASHRKP